MTPRPRLYALLLVLVVVAAHAVSFGAGFIWDDDDYVTENRTLESLDGLKRIWLEIGATPQYYPLVHTTFWIEHRLWGERAAGYHAVNVLLHAGSTLLIWTILRRLSVPGAWLAAALFGIHPVHAESVAWITERKNVLSGILSLAAILAWIAFDTSRRRRDYALSLAAFVAALLSKTVAATLPATFLVIAWWRRGALTRRDVVPTIPYVVLGTAAGMLTAWMERFHVGASGGDWALTFLERVQVAGRAVWFYLGKLVWPHPLMFVYPRWKVASWGIEGWMWPLAAVAVVAVLFALRGRIGRGPLAAALYFGLTLSPALGFVNFYPMRFSHVADHFQYMASLGPIALAAALFVAKVRAAWRPALAPVLLLALAVLTWRQEGIYRDEETLWRRTIAVDPNVFLAQNNLGGMLLERGATDEAEPHLRLAVSIEPTYPEGHDNLGIVLHRTGRVAEAIEQYRAAIRLDPRFPYAHNNLGISLAETGRLDDAIAAFGDAVRLKPDFTRAHFNLGVALYRKGDVEGAEASLREAARLGDPDAGSALARLGATAR